MSFPGALHAVLIPFGDMILLVWFVSPSLIWLCCLLPVSSLWCVIASGVGWLGSLSSRWWVRAVPGLPPITKPIVHLTACVCTHRYCICQMWCVGETSPPVHNSNQKWEGCLWRSPSPSSQAEVVSACGLGVGEEPVHPPQSLCYPVGGSLTRGGWMASWGGWSITLQVIYIAVHFGL